MFEAFKIVNGIRVVYSCGLLANFRESIVSVRFGLELVLQDEALVRFPVREKLLSMYGIGDNPLQRELVVETNLER